MSHQIKRLRCTVLTAGSAGGNFPATIDAQSSTWGPATMPSQPGPTVNRAARAGALAHLKPNPLSRRAPRYYAAVSATGFLTGKAAEAGEIIPFGWPVLDRDKRMPFGDRRRGRPDAGHPNWLASRIPSDAWFAEALGASCRVHSDATSLWPGVGCLRYSLTER